MAGGRLDEGQPSATALRVAVRRAAHQLVDRPPVFEDPFALKVIGPDVAEALERNLEQEAGPWSRAMRAFMAARSRCAEDQLALAYGRGVRQCVVMGAGLDTFALRNPYTDLRVFEVDHPATQAWKRTCLEAAGLAVPQSLTFAPVDFQREGLAEGLEAAGFDGGRPAFCSWLGVAMYLDEAAVWRTLEWVAGLPPGGGIVFDFMVRPELMEARSRLAAEALAARVAAAGEPFRSAFDPDALAQGMRQAGFAEAETLGAEELNRLYFDGRADGLRLTGSGRIAVGRV